MLALSEPQSSPFPIFPTLCLQFFSSFPLHHFLWNNKTLYQFEETKKKKKTELKQRDGRFRLVYTRLTGKKERKQPEWWGACWLSVSYQRLNPDGLQTHLLFILFRSLCCPSSSLFPSPSPALCFCVWLSSSPSLLLLFPWFLHSFNLLFHK